MKQILLIQTAFIGDVILATPVLERLHEAFPDAKIDFLLRKGNEKLLDHHPFIREVLIWNKKSQKTRGLLTLTRQIRQRNYDLVVNMQRFFSSGILAGFSGAKRIVGFNKNPLSFLFTKAFPHQIDLEDEFVHEVDRNLSLLEGICSTKTIRPKLYPSITDQNRVRQKNPYICIAPTSVWFTKQVPAKKWVELIEKLPNELHIHLLGGPTDQAACEAIKSACPNKTIINQAGKLSFLQSAALMQNAQMNYVNDSAPLHIASAMNAPVTALFCSTVPAFGFTPLSENSIIWESPYQLDCRPCGLHGKKACPKGHFKCGEIELKI